MPVKNIKTILGIFLNQKTERRNEDDSSKVSYIYD